MTANDIRDQKFTRIRRTGYRKDEVDDFLREVTDQYAQLQEQASDAQSESARLRVLVHDLQQEAERLRRENEAAASRPAEQEAEPQENIEEEQRTEEQQGSAQLDQMSTEIQALRRQLAALAAATRSQPEDGAICAQAADAGETEPAGQWEARRQQAFCLREESFKDNQAIHAWQDVAEYASVQRQQLDQFAASSLSVAAEQLERGMELVRECDKQLLQMQKIRKNVRALLASMSETAQSFREEALYFSGTGEEPPEMPKPEILEEEEKEKKRRTAKRAAAGRKTAKAKKTKEEKMEQDSAEEEVQK